jgi:hypothetical protein
LESGDDLSVHPVHLVRGDPAFHAALCGYGVGGQRKIVRYLLLKTKRIAVTNTECVAVQTVKKAA